MSGLIHISYSKVYQYKNITFEWHNYLGPTFLRRCDHEFIKRQWDFTLPMRTYSALSQWLRLTEEERANYRII